MKIVRTGASLKKLRKNFQKKVGKKLKGWYYGYISTDKDFYGNDGDWCYKAKETFEVKIIFHQNL